jgi:predicted adenine nucleotide alpha hydrolase (AANH) superfamily ATPase
MPVQRLRDLGYMPTLYYLNPNIHPLTEYLRRRDALLEIATRLDVPVLLPDQDDPSLAHPAQWLGAVAALGPGMRDLGQRCPLCYAIRLDATALAAANLGFARFTTTLLYSKYQSHEAILAAGEDGARRAGLEFVGEDFRPGWDEGQRLAREWGVYRQPYCGCMLSEHERYRKKLPCRQ